MAAEAVSCGGRWKGDSAAVAVASRSAVRACRLAGAGAEEDARTTPPPQEDFLLEDEDAASEDKDGKNKGMQPVTAILEGVSDSQLAANSTQEWMGAAR